MRNLTNTTLPRFVGVDDWATRKGRSYGTILIDLERDTVIDLLPGRDGESLWMCACWLSTCFRRSQI